QYDSDPVPAGRPRSEATAAPLTWPRTLNDYRIGGSAASETTHSAVTAAMIVAVAAIAAGAFVMVDPLHLMPRHDAGRVDAAATSVAPATASVAGTLPAPVAPSVAMTANRETIADAAPAAAVAAPT